MVICLWSTSTITTQYHTSPHNSMSSVNKVSPNYIGSMNGFINMFTQFYSTSWIKAWISFYEILDGLFFYHTFFSSNNRFLWAKRRSSGWKSWAWWITDEADIYQRSWFIFPRVSLNIFFNWHVYELDYSRLYLMYFFVSWNFSPYAKCLFVLRKAFISCQKLILDYVLLTLYM